MENITSISQAGILEGLRQFSPGGGSLRGASLMVHSSLKSFGRVEGGPRAVIEALMEALTPEGTLMLPSFNHYVPFEEGGAGIYDPIATPTSNGAIPDLFWRLPGVCRSLDPAHPVAVWGRNSQRYTRAHHRTLTMGPDSPLGMLWREGGYGLLLGVGYGSNTFHHVVEMTTGAPCLGRRTEAYPVLLPDGRTVQGRTWGWRAGTCPLNDRAVYAAEMEARGLHQVVHIGNCRATLFRLQDCFEVIADLLRSGKNGAPPCSACPIRPRRVPQTVASDWDEQACRPLPESVAWTY